METHKAGGFNFTITTSMLVNPALIPLSVSLGRIIHAPSHLWIQETPTKLSSRLYILENSRKRGKQYNLVMESVDFEYLLINSVTGKMQRKCMLRVADDDIKPPIKTVPDIFDFF